MRSTDPEEEAPQARTSGFQPDTEPGAERDRLFQARDMVLGGLFGALGIVVPMLFHAVGLGKVFLPMYLPILALGLMVSWEVALIVGCATPLLSAVLTGMPPLAPPIAALMATELACLAAVASLARRVGLSSHGGHRGPRHVRAAHRAAAKCVAVRRRLAAAVLAGGSPAVDGRAGGGVCH
jgi:hypothetical protein